MKRDFMKQSFFSISCDKCGGPLYFDIVKKDYCCPSCGSHDPAESVTNRIREINGQDRDNTNKLLDSQLKTKSVYQCSKCGATKVNDGGLADVCDYCGHALAVADFSGKDFPVSIIPFNITRDEAIYIFKSWMKEHRKNDWLEIILKNIDEHLEMNYLPYRMVKGDFELSVSSYSRKHRLPACLYGIYVSDTRRLNNKLLEAVEPFDISGFEDFDFKYIAGHKALMPDLSQDTFDERLDWEILNAYQPAVEKVLGKSMVPGFNKRKYEIGSKQNLVERSVYMPMFTLTHRGIPVLAINGQTGRLAYLRDFEVEKADDTFYSRIGRKLVVTNRAIEDDYRTKKLSFRKSFAGRLVSAIPLMWIPMLVEVPIFILVRFLAPSFLDINPHDGFGMVLAMVLGLFLMIAPAYMMAEPYVEFASESSKKTSSDGSFDEEVDDSRLGMWLAIIGVGIILAVILVISFIGGR